MNYLIVACFFILNFYFYVPIHCQTHANYSYHKLFDSPGKFYKYFLFHIIGLFNFNSLQTNFSNRELFD